MCTPSNKKRKNTTDVASNKKKTCIPLRKKNKTCISSNKNNKTIILSNNKEKMSTSGCLLPDEIIREILSRVPAKILLRWILVCKKWFHMFTSDHSFIDAQIARSRPVGFMFDVDLIGCFEVDWVFDDIKPAAPLTAFNFNRIFPNQSNWITAQRGKKIAIDGRNTLVCGAWNGLVCIIRHDSENVRNKFSSYYIANPATRQWARLPRSNLALAYAMRFGYDPSSKKYKLVHFSIRSERLGLYNPRCEVLTIGAKTWREIECPPLPSRLGDPPVVLEQFMHWLPNADYIVSLDLSTEMFRKINIPCMDSNTYYIFKMGDSLALGDGDLPTENIFDIWVLEDYCSGIWKKKYSITLDLYKLPLSFCEDYYPAASFNNGEIVIFKEDGGPRLFCYELRCQRFSEIMTNWKDRGTNLKVYHCASTLISPVALIA